MRFFSSKQREGVHNLFIPKKYPSKLFKFKLLSRPELPLVLHFGKCLYSYCLRSYAPFITHDKLLSFISVFADFPVLSMEFSFPFEHEISFSNHNIINICNQTRLALKKVLSKKSNDPIGFHKFIEMCLQWGKSPYVLSRNFFPGKFMKFR